MQAPAVDRPARIATRLLLAVGLLGGLVACPEPPPPGTDTVDVFCICRDSCTGEQLTVPGLVCTNSVDPDNVVTAAAFVCEKKETIGTPGLCKIENCGPQQKLVTLGACPADNGDFFTGDFGQSVSAAIDPSSVRISGGDINAFTIHPETMRVETTQTGSNLFFGSMDATLGTTGFTSDGIFGDDDHTLSEGRLAAAPFTVQLEPSGDFVVPPGTGTFIVTGKVDGDRLSLSLTSVSLEGTYDEDAGLFTLSGRVDGQGFDLNIDVDLVFKFTNRPPRAVVQGDTIVECDSSALTGSGMFSGSQSFDFDGADDLAFYTWDLDGTQAASGVVATLPIPLGSHAVGLTVADRRGSTGVAALGVVSQDTTAPAIDIVEPRPIQYTHSQTIVLDYAVGDVCTGVASVAPRLDGSATLAGHGLPDGQSIPLLTELALGTHTFAITAADVQGNPGQSSVVFEIIVTAQSIQEDVNQFVALGAIRPASLGQFLLSKLQAAATARERGNCKTAASNYESFISAVQAQTGKGIDPTAAAILIADARYLISHCP